MFGESMNMGLETQSTVQTHLFNYLLEPWGMGRGENTIIQGIGVRKP